MSLSVIWFKSCLYASNEYIFKAINVFSEMAIKLTHVLWNKIFKEDSKNIGQSIHDISYETLERGKYDLVIAISPLFLSKPFTSIGEVITRTSLINYCIALKEVGNKKDSDKLLDGYDWTACDTAFKMAERILREDYKSAALYMKKSYDMGDLQKEDIDQWPLFLQFRKTDEFKELYDSLSTLIIRDYIFRGPRPQGLRPSLHTPLPSLSSYMIIIHKFPT